MTDKERIRIESDNTCIIVISKGRVGCRSVVAYRGLAALLHRILVLTITLPKRPSEYIFQMEVVAIFKQLLSKVYIYIQPQSRTRRLVLVAWRRFPVAQESNNNDAKPLGPNIT